MTNQQAPYSQSAEEAVLGAVLTAPLCYLNISAFLKSSDFFFVRHAYIWDAIGRLETRQEPIDTLTLSRELETHNQLAEIGGPAFLTQLISNTPTSAHAEIYGHLVYRTSKRRQLMIVCDEVKLMCLDETDSWNHIGEQAEAKMLSVTASERKQEATDIHTIAHEFLDSTELTIAQREQGIMPGLPTGYSSIDDITGGAYKKELTIYAGPAKSGKSTLNLNIARNRAKLGASIVIFIAEMDRAAIVRKFVSMEADIPIKTIKNAAFSPQEYSRFVEASNKVSQWKIHIIDEYGSPTPLDIRRELRRIMHKESVDYVLIDGLWKMRSNTPTGVKHEDINQISVDLADMVKKLNLPFDVVHQMNNAPNTRKNPRPILSDLGGSIGVSQNASTLIFLHRESYYKGDNEEDDVEVIVKATRDGETGVAKLGFRKSGELYHELEPSAPYHYTSPRTEPDTSNRKDLH